MQIAVFNYRKLGIVGQDDTVVDIDDLKSSARDPIIPQRRALVLD